MSEWVGWILAASFAVLWILERRAHKHNLKACGDNYSDIVKKLTELRDSMKSND